MRRIFVYEAFSAQRGDPDPAYADLLDDGRKLRSLEKEADGVFRAAVSQLFKDPAVDAKVLLREKEVLEDLENAVDHCDNVADTLANIAVKHG